MKYSANIKPLWGNYSRSSGIVSFSVFEKKMLPANSRIPQLFGFVAPMNVADIREGGIDFSIFDLSSTEELLMLGPASLKNSSSESNSSFDSQQKESLPSFNSIQTYQSYLV